LSWAIILSGNAMSMRSTAKGAAQLIFNLVIIMCVAF
jgi:hypothetical protein